MGKTSRTNHFDRIFASKRGKIVSFVVAFAALSIFYTNCTQENLTPLSESLVGVFSYGAVNANFCLSSPTAAQQNIKYLFIIDHSSSNKPGIPSSPGDMVNTDPDGSRRYGPLINFVESMTPNASISTSFDIIDFSDQATQVTGLNSFDASSSDFISIATTDWVGNGTNSNPSPLDSGFTNYESALSEAYTIIKQDLQSSSLLPTATIVSNTYQIIFVTDGIPTVPSGSSLYTQQFTTDLAPLIANVMSLKSDAVLGPYVGNITLNTAFYYNNNVDAGLLASAQQLLQQMATAGNGLFVQFAGGEQVLYQQFSPPQVNVQTQLVDVFLQNENAVWWDNGQLMQDSDGDGLPDLIEMQMGSDPHNPDSDGNGVSDLVEYRTKGKPCSGANCAPSGRDSYAICAGFNPTVDNSNNVHFSSTSNDGMNDCEKYVMGGNYHVFSSPGDYIPDFMALRNAISIQPGNANVAFNDPFGNGMTNYYKLKVGLPTQISVNAVSAFTPRVSQLTVTSAVSAGTTCYNFAVNNVALTAPNNKVSVYVVQNSSAIQDKPILTKATATMGSNFSISFQPGDFH